MTYLTHPISSALTIDSRITTMVFVALVLIVMLSSPAQAQWTTSGNNISNSNTGNVGIGTQSPTEKLEVNGTVKSGGLTVTGAPSEPAYLNGLFLGMNGTTATIDAVDQMVDFRDLSITNKTFKVSSWNGGGLVTGLFQSSSGNVGTRRQDRHRLARFITHRRVSIHLQLPSRFTLSADFSVDIDTPN